MIHLQMKRRLSLSLPLGLPQAGKKLPSTFKSALRVDPLLAGNWTIVSKALEEGCALALLIQKGTRVLISLWDSLMFGRVPGYPPEH